TTMTPHRMLSDVEVWQLVSFLRFIDVPDDVRPVSADAQLAAAVHAPYEEIASLRAPGKDWLTYSGSYYGTRHSTLDQIDRSNVETLGLAWLHQFPQEPLIEATPLVRDGVMYISIPPCSVHALNAATGRTIWTWTCDLLNEG